MKLNREQITELFGSAPEDQDGKKLVGVEIREPNRGDLYLNLDSQTPEWIMDNRGDRMYKYPVAIFETVAQPTTLADLVGEDGQKSCWLHAYNGAHPLLAGVANGNLRIYRVLCDQTSIGEAIDLSLRYSHSPFTSYEDANKFTK